MAVSVRFFALEDFSPHDPTSHKRLCPFCDDGLLLMERDRATLELLAEDQCVSCGQKVVYLDIERIRRERP